MKKLTRILSLIALLTLQASHTNGNNAKTKNFSKNKWDKIDGTFLIYRTFINPEEALSTMKRVVLVGLVNTGGILLFEYKRQSPRSFNFTKISAAMHAVICAYCYYEAYANKDHPKEIFMRLSDEGLEDDKGNFYAWKDVEALELLSKGVLTLKLCNKKQFPIKLDFMAIGTYELQGLIDQLKPFHSVDWSYKWKMYKYEEWKDCPPTTINLFAACNYQLLTKKPI